MQALTSVGEDSIDERGCKFSGELEVKNSKINRGRSKPVEAGRGENNTHCLSLGM